MGNVQINITAFIYVSVIKTFYNSEIGKYINEIRIAWKTNCIIIAKVER